MLLNVESLSAGYGDAVVLEQIGFSLLESGSLVLLGRNGAGKSTLALTLMGHARIRSGRVMLRDREITHEPAHKRVLLGLAWVPQEREVFPSLTVAEHLAITARRGPWSIERVYRLFPRLEDRKAVFGAQLSGGEQQMLAIARALVTNPSLLILDEPLEGLAPLIVEELTDTLRRLVDESMGMILIEQHARFALSIADQAIVLDRGKIAYCGLSATLLRDSALMDRLVGMRRLSV